MTILDFVTQDELDNLDDDPRMAFMSLVNHAQRRFSEKTERLDPEDQHQYDRREELRYSFMNVILASAKRFKIEPFYSMEVPRYTKFTDVDYRQFKYDLENYVTQMMIDNSLDQKLILLVCCQNLKTNFVLT